MNSRTADAAAGDDPGRPTRRERCIEEAAHALASCYRRLDEREARARTRSMDLSADRPKAYDVHTHRDGSWWMVEVPALHGLTQARKSSDVRQEAVDWIALATGVDSANIAIRVVNDEER